MDLQKKLDLRQKEIEAERRRSERLDQLNRAIYHDPGALPHARELSLAQLRELLDEEPVEQGGKEDAAAEELQRLREELGEWEARAMEAHRLWEREFERARALEAEVANLRARLAHGDQLAEQKAVLMHELAWFCRRFEKGEVDARRASRRFGEVLEEMAVGGGLSQNSGGA